jgi:hypothetical protein
MKKILVILSVLLVFSACSKLEDLNKNVKDFAEVSGESLYNGATRQLINQLSNQNVNSNVTVMWIQHLAATTYFDETRYDMTTRGIPLFTSNTLYRLVLMNYKEAARVLQIQPLAGISQAQRDNQLAIIEVMTVYAWNYVIENFGDMPYSEALDFNIPTPVYDDGLTIYKDLIDRLSTAMDKLTLTEACMPPGYDNIFGGTGNEAEMWYKFANTLKLRMGLMLYDVDANYSKSVVEAVERGFSVGGTAEGHYNNAVRSSILYWGGTEAEADAYMAQPSVAYSTSFSDWKQKIGTQAWLAYWLRGQTLWNSYRRLDYPRLFAPPEFLQEIDKVPVRLFYPVSEQTLNAENYEAASTKIGGDSPLTRLFFDEIMY